MHSSVWLLFLCSIATIRASSSPADRDLKILSLYRLPSVSITFVSTNVETAAQSDNRLLISDEVKQVTESYLEEYIQASLSQVSDYEDLTLQTVDLEGSLRSQYLGNGRVGYAGDFFGTLGVTDIPARPPAAELEPVLETFVERAFAPAAYAAYRDKLERSDFLELQNVEDLTIKVNEAAGDFPTLAPTDEEKRPIGFIVLVILLVLAISLLLFIFAQRRSRMIRYGAASQTPEYMYPDYDPESGEFPICTSFPEMNLQANGDPEHNGTNGNANYIPVAYDAAHTYGADGVQRRYVASWNPLEMLYGASYMHSQEPYQRHALERPQLKRKTSKDFVPMLQPESPTSTWLAWPSWLSTSPRNALNQDHPFVYRDFPRHDGTPCLIYTPSEDGHIPSAPQPQPRTSIVSRKAPIPLRKSISIGTDSSDGNDSTKEMAKDLYAQLADEDKLDSFVDRLETLIKLKHRQFEERNEIEKERLEIRRQLEVKRAHAIAHRAVLESPSHSRESSAVTPAIAAMAVGATPPPPTPQNSSASLGLTATRKQFDQVMANSTAGSLMAQASREKLIEEKAQLVEDELAAIEASAMGESSPGPGRHRKSEVLPYDEITTSFDPNFVIDDAPLAVASPAPSSGDGGTKDPPSQRAGNDANEPAVVTPTVKEEKKQENDSSPNEIV